MPQAQPEYRLNRRSTADLQPERGQQRHGTNIRDVFTVCLRKFHPLVNTKA